MKTLALRGPVRRAIAWLHRWSGLAVLVFLCIAGVTGSVLAFRDEVDRWINPHLFVVTPHGDQAPLTDVLALVESRFPPARVSSVTFPTRPDESLSVFLRAKEQGRRLRGTSDAVAFNTVFVDPYELRVLGYRSSTRMAWTRAAVIPIVVRLHYSLLLERPGVWLMGVCAAIWLLTNLCGLALAWPAAWRRVIAWVPILSVRTRGGVYKANYDVHRAGSVWLLLVLVVLAFTSVYLNFPSEMRAAVNAVAPVTPSPVGRPFAGTPPISPEVALQQARVAVPRGSPRSVFRDFENGWYSISLRLPDVAPYGNNRVYVDFTTGAVVERRLASASTAGDVVMQWLFPLHTGSAFGLAGRILIALTGLLMVVLNGTGVYVWFYKSSLRRWMSARTRANGERDARVAGPAGGIAVPADPGRGLAPRGSV